MRAVQIATAVLRSVAHPDISPRLFLQHEGKVLGRHARRTISNDAFVTSGERGYPLRSLRFRGGIDGCRITTRVGEVADRIECGADTFGALRHLRFEEIAHL